MPFVSMKSFIDADGRLNWQGYKKAQLENGDICSRCGHCIGIGTGQQRMCYDCEALVNDKQEALHTVLIRCPKCQCTFEPNYSGDSYEYMTKGKHEIKCPMCEHFFIFYTYVSCQFESPAVEAESGK